MPEKDIVPALRTLGRALRVVAGIALLGCGAAGDPTGDEYATDVTLAVHDVTSTILIVSWTQAVSAEATWLEFAFENDEVSRSPRKPGAAGAHQEVVLGVPAETEVTIRVVSEQAGEQYRTRDHVGTTGPLPAGLPRAEVNMYDAARASPERYLLGAVEDSLGGCGAPCYSLWTDWLYIMDRKGRMVWYYADPSGNADSAYPRLARDGQYLWIDKRPPSVVAQRGVLKTTLDGRYTEEIALPISECIDVTDDGSVLFDTPSGVLSERNARGELRQIWDCPAHFGPAFDCFSNTVSWSPETGTILLAFPKENTLIEIERQSGAVVGQYGDAPDSYAFSPPSWKFEYPHFPNFTPHGTLLVSSHMPGYSDTYQPVAGQHAFVEFAIDRDGQRLVEQWVYDAGEEWPMYKGMALRLANGNTLVNYGSGGVLREVTPDADSVFELKFDAPEGDDFYNKMLGNSLLIDDLYALNGGPE